MIRSEVIKIIDNCRDVLVGKIPDPITQVEQITIALIYKFMNDMDEESIEMGGTASFFCGPEKNNQIDFSQYSWKNILDSRNGAYKMLDLYSEGITKIKENQNVPNLFKQILKDAYLPYNDPRVLGLFLKEINKISYEDSESLGEAFEYLLSIMGSQGDAGQFRTPRHIIDFIVKIINPQKNESILDPACGTAGFLISAFKYIKEQNNNILTSQENETLSKNLVGYDISPTMERLSKVNLYLHNLKNPQIYQYDTLSNDTYWENKFNIILANPPFMTPKGGIEPHNKFTLKSNRSEALFCDYINSHLKPNGRAGFIVPEGIIFKTDKAYKKLRKSLIEESLIAVISLPSGVFNPYSNVKTNILILDKKLHKQTDKVLFITIKNDGYSLGTQRKPIQFNDLPQAIECFNTFKNSIINGNNCDDLLQFKNTLLVNREEILNTCDCILSVNRYKKEEKVSSKWEMVELGEVCELSSGNSAPQDSLLFENGIFPFCRTSDLAKYHLTNNLIDIKDRLNEHGIKNLKLFKKGTILFPKSGASILLNHRAILGVDSYVSSHLATIYTKNIVTQKYIYYILSNIDSKNIVVDSSYPSLKITDIAKITIPLPPLEIQEKIVKEIEGYEKIINGCREVVENWKPKFEIKEKWEMVELGGICEIRRGASPRPINEFITEDISGINWVKIGDVSETNKYVSHAKQKITVEGAKKSVIVNKGDFILSNSMSFGRPYIMNITGCIHDGWLVFKNIKDYVNKDFLYYILKSEYVYNLFLTKAIGGTVSNLNIDLVKTIQIPLPPLAEQEEIVAKIEEEEKYIDGCKKMIEIYKEKIKGVIDGVVNKK